MSGRWWNEDCDFIRVGRVRGRAKERGHEFCISNTDVIVQRRRENFQEKMAGFIIDNNRVVKRREITSKRPVVLWLLYYSR